MSRLESMLLIVALSLSAGAGAQLQAEPAGGPLTLAEEVEEAFDVWQQAFPTEALEEPAAHFAFAGDLLGPDTASLTLRYDDGRTEVLLAPERYMTGPVLVHEIGVLLGLAEAGTGVMDPSLEAEGPTAPTAVDLAMLDDLRAYPAADLTRDGVVDFYDLAAFGASYGSVGINLRADLDGDGRVGETDLAILREAYVHSEPARTAPIAGNLDPGTPVRPDDAATDGPALVPGGDAETEAADQTAGSPEGEDPDSATNGEQLDDEEVDEEVVDEEEADEERAPDEEGADEPSGDAEDPQGESDPSGPD